MLTTLSITSRSQGQIHGAKPSLEEIERQLEADPMTCAVSRCAHMLAALVSGLRRARLSGMKLEPVLFDGAGAGKSEAL